MLLDPEEVGSILEDLKRLQAKSGVQALLRSKGASFSGDWDKVAARVRSAAANGALGAPELGQLVNSIENYGFQRHRGPDRRRDYHATNHTG